MSPLHLDPTPPRQAARTRTRASLARRAVTVGSALLAVVLVVLLAVICHDRDDYLRQLQARAERSAAQHAASLRRDLDAVGRLAAVLAERVALGEGPTGLSRAAARDQGLLALGGLRGVAIADPQGLQVLVPAEDGAPHPAIAAAAAGPWPDDGVSALRVLPRPSDGLTDCGPPPVALLMRALTRPAGGRRLIVAVIDLDALLASAGGDTLHGGRVRLVSADDERPLASTDCAAPPAMQAGTRPGVPVAARQAVAAYPLGVVVEVDRHVALVAWWSAMHDAFLLAAAVALLVYGIAMKLVLRSMQDSDATSRRLGEAEAAVLAKAADLAALIQSLQELVFRTDADGVITYANHDWRGVSGTELRYAEGRRLWDLVSGAAARERVQALFAAQGAPGPRRAQASTIDAAGKTRIFDITVHPAPQGAERAGFTGSVVDVTEQVEARKKLQSQLVFTELLMDTSPLPTAVLDLQGCYTKVNRAWETFYGVHRGHLIGRSFGNQTLSPQAKALHRQNDERLIERQALSVRYETQAVRGDGANRDIVFEKALMAGDRGLPAGVLVVMVDVTDYRRAERTTREARDAAEEASRAKSEFIANISHELRTPLQSIIGFSELGTLRASPGDRLASMFGEVRDAGHRMLKLVNDLLDVSKIESTVGTMHLEVTDLRSVVREVTRELEPQLTERGLQVDFDLPRQPLPARIDPSRFKQVLRNILANAIKFSPRQGRIQVLAEPSMRDEPQICISDQGPGIPPDECEAIFEAFVQSSGTKDGAGGTGLGLTICRKIVEAHGGRIHATNAPGGGARFCIVLPAREARSTVAAALD